MKPKTKKILTIFFLGVLFFANFSSAQLVNCGRTGQTECKLIDMVYLIERVINFMLAWAWLISIFMILWSAFILVGSNGNEEAVAAGKQTLKHAIIGFFLIMAAYLLINWFIFVLTGTDPNGEPGTFEKIINLIRRP